MGEMQVSLLSWLDVSQLDNFHHSIDDGDACVQTVLTRNGSGLEGRLVDVFLARDYSIPFLLPHTLKATPKDVD